MVPMIESDGILYVEKLRCDAYFSVQGIARLKLLKLDYDFWSHAAPDEYRDAWKETSKYCNSMLQKLGAFR